MTRGTFFLLAPVIVAASAMFVFHGGEIERADYFFFQVIGGAIAIWIFVGTARVIGR